MSRAERLLDLMQNLRRRRHAVSGAVLAEELGISLRTLYRDIASLQTQGAHISGSAGTGYLLRPGFNLPPLMFSIEEIEALVLGSRWVVSRTDTRLAAAAEHALAKIAAVVPSHLLPEVHNTALRVGPNEESIGHDEWLTTIRSAIRKEHKLKMRYQDLLGNTSARVIWPFVLGYFDRTKIVGAWCEMRQEIRHFRIDRIQSLTLLDMRYPQRRHALIKQWEMQEKLCS